MAERLTALLERQLDEHREQIEARALRVTTELDPAWPRVADVEVVEAVRALLRLVFTTVPDGCELYVAARRTAEPVASLEAGEITLRWQVPGPTPSATSPVTPIHPRAGDARTHAGSKSADAVRRAFLRAGWTFELEVLEPGLELLARARTGPG